MPFNGRLLDDRKLSFSFSSFDRSHKLFNLGGTAEDGTVGGRWFIDLLDCLKEIDGKTLEELKGSKFDPHPVDWRTTNMNPPVGTETLEYWQLRLDKSSGRIVAIKLENVLYIVWLDPHHNTTDSPHYEAARRYRAPMSTYEYQQQEICRLTEELDRIKLDYSAALELISEYTKPEA